MGKRSYLSLHLILDLVSSEIDSFADRLAKTDDVQVWIVRGSVIKTGRIPKVFKKIPLDNVKYHNGWLTIETSKDSQAALASHIFVVFDARREGEIRQIIRSLRKSLKLPLREML